MLKLIYDYRCGFKELYITEKDCEWDFTAELDCLQNEWDCEGNPPTEEELFEEYKDCPQALLDDVFTGVEECIYSFTCEECSHTYFKHICFEDPKHPYLVGYFKMYNLRLVLENKEEAKVDNETTTITKTIEVNCAGKTKDEIKQEITNIKRQLESKGLKAKDVMAILGISRQTLSNYVKKGLLKTSSKYDGGQYTYDYDSVMKLKEGK